MSAGVGGSYSSSKSSNNSKNYPGWASGELQQLAPALGLALNNYDPSGGPERATAIQQLMATASGQYTDPNTNPEIQNVIKGLEDQSSRTWQSTSRDVAQSAQRGGNLFSSAASKAAGQAGENVQSDLDSQIANILYGNQQTERGNQMSATNQLLNVGPNQLNQVMAIVNALKGLEGRSSGIGRGWGVQGSAEYKMA